MCLFAAIPARAAEQKRNLFGPEKFIRTTGAPNDYERTFNVPAYVGSPYSLEIINGAPDGSNGSIPDAVSSATVSLDGQEIVKRNEFSKTTATIRKEITLTSGSHRLEVQVSSAPDSYFRLTISGTIPLADLGVARSGHSATSQNDGSLLFAGGIGSAGASAESFDPATLKTSPLQATLRAGRFDHSANSLPRGETLIIGGSDSNGPLPSSELFRSSSKTFAPIPGSPRITRTGHSATLLGDGSVLILGGAGATGASLRESESFNPNQDPLTGALYDPSTGVFTLLPNALLVPRANHTATLLSSGQVLVAGGRNADGVLASAELFDPATGRSTLLSASMNSARAEHSATLRPDGSVLIAGGAGASGLLDSIEIYVSQTFSDSPTRLIMPRRNHTATLLPIGEILIAGGEGANGTLAHTELVGPPAADTAAPQIGATTPVNGATGVDLNAIVGVRFSEPIDVSAINVRLTAAGAAVAGVTGSGESGLYAFFVPSQLFRAGALHTVELQGIRDLAGNSLANVSFSFTTVAAPAISSFAPTHGTRGTQVRIFGSGFDPSGPQRNIVAVGTNSAVVSAVDETTLTISIPQAAAIGAQKITVKTRGGTVISADDFTVDNPVPTLTSISPTQANANSAAITINASGSLFAPNAVVYFGANALATMVTNANALTGQIPASLLTTAGLLPVRVFNPPPGGGFSGILNFTVIANKASIGNFIWNDRNANGIQEPGEPGIGGVSVSLLSASGTVLRTSSTDANGTYRFGDLDPGSYAVRVIPPPGFSFSPSDAGDDDARDSDYDTNFDRTAFISVIAGDNVTSLDAGLFIPAAHIAETSPRDGEGDVAVTRETILRLTQPLAAIPDPTQSSVYAEFGGLRLSTRIHVAPDRRAITLFYDQDLPASARIRVTLIGDALRDVNGNAVDADGDGRPGGTAHLDFDTLTLTTLTGTRACGRVFASTLGAVSISINVPLPGVTITVDGMETSLRTVTDAQGNFCLDPAPVGEFFVHIDGRTATIPIPVGDYYPSVGKKWRSIAGQSVNIGEIYLPRIIAGTLQPVSRVTDTVIGFPLAVLAQFPNFAGVKITVPADSLYSDNGSRGGMVGIAPVPSDRLPSPLPPGIAFPIVITVQTDGASNFDRPVPACFPNIANPLTGAPPLPPNSTSALWSFNHDTGQFEIVGPMTVSADGQLVCTDPGIGILAPGWHGTLPGTNVSCHPPDEKKEKDCDEIQNDLNQNYQNKKNAGSASRGFAHQLSCIASRGCHDPVTDKPDDPNRKIRNVFAADADEATRNPVDTVCDKIKPWIPSQPGDEHIISRNDVCTVMAGLLYHFPITLTMSFNWNCPIPVPEHDKLINEAIVPCFDELAASGDISTIGAGIAKFLVPTLARAARDRANRGCTNRSQNEPRIALLAGSTRMFTRDDLFMPSLDNVGLRVRAPNDDYFLRVGTKVQLRVTRSSGQDVTPASTGTLYFVVTPDDIATITPEGELSILAAPVPWPDYTQPFYVVVRNGNDFGVGQFAIEDVDTDGDGVVDSVERRCGSDPNSNNPSVDSDDDTIPDVVEASMMLNARSRDTDGDHIQDNVELQNGLNPLVPSEDALTELRDPTYYSVTNARTGFTVRGKTSNGLLTNLTLAQLETYYASFYDVRNGKVGFVRFTTPQNGLSQMMPRVVLRDPLPLDTDLDGLPDEVEAIIGTRPDLADSDHDGVSDKAEIDQGTNPLDGAPSVSGIVQSVKTLGTAVDVCAVNDMAVVAESTAGVAVFNVFNGMNPTSIAQVDTPGDARAVACAGNRIAVADSTAGLAIIDITDPPAAKIAYQLRLGNAQAVTASAGIAYVGLDIGQIVSVDLNSGSILEEIHGLPPIHDLAIERDTLLVLTSTDLRAFDLSSGSLQARGSVSTAGSPEGITRRRRLFVGGGYAYAASYRGYDVIDVRNPAALVRLGAAVFGGGALSFKQIVANGSGIGVAAVGVLPGDDGTHDIWLYDVSNPNVTNRLLTVLPTPGITRALSIYNGLAYVADSNAGLQVVNYLPSDTRGIAPTIQLETNFAAGLAEEGHPMRLTANVSDDVQVRNVQFYVDGVKVMTDGNFPFEFRFITPLMSQKAAFTIRACATDTGGNSTCTAETTVTLTQDATPPRVTAITPIDGAGVGAGTLSAISATFSEPIAASSLSTATFQLFASGPDGLIGTADDRLVSGGTLSYRDDVNKAFLTFPSVLAIDLYRAVIRSSVSDQKGNPLGADFVWTFRVKGPNTWINPNGGLWIDPNNWSDKKVPVATDNIFISQPGNYTVVVDHSVQVQQLTIGGVNSTPTMWIKGSGAGGHVTLTVTGNVINSGRIRLESADSTYTSLLVVQNGALTNFGTIEVNEGSGGTRTLTANLSNPGTINVNYNTPFDGTITNSGIINLAAGKKLSSVGNQNVFNQAGGTINGPGALEMNGGTFNFTAGPIVGLTPLLINVALNFGGSNDPATFIQTAGGSTVRGTIAANQTLWISGRGAGSHTIMSAPIGLTNAGTIRIESADSTYQSQLTITTGALTNTGTIQINQGSGGSRAINGTLINQGTINVGVAMDYTGTLTNTGTINIASGQKLLLGSGQTFNHNGGTIAGTGSLELTSSTFNFNGGTTTGTTPLLINSTLNFGTSTSAASFIQTGGSSRATGTIAPAQTLWVSGRGAGSHTTLTLANGLTNAGSIRLESIDSTYQSLITITGGTLINNGTIDVNQGAGGSRTITGAFLN
ncbi:MAG TPA: SdrD B-like domain-containing protein, partial [Thermoanaerobaculia bacterium]|nr:SdrD B-like domain-containing protein [Thermoanaerobaculia bacterium]